MVPTRSSRPPLDCPPKRHSGQRWLVLLLLPCILMGAACSKKNPTQPDPTPGPSLKLFGRNSYCPIVQGAIWTYDDGTTVQAVELSDNTFRIVNIGSSGSMDGIVGRDTRGAYVSWTTYGAPDFLPLEGNFGYKPLVYEDTTLVLGLTWSDEGIVNSSRFENRCTITALDSSFAVPGGPRFDGCAILDRQIVYPQGSDQSPSLISVRHYLKRGVGFVARTRHWSNGSTDQRYVTSYTIP